jgi:hypothetical protein
VLRPTPAPALTGEQTLYSVELSKGTLAGEAAAFLRPPVRLMSTWYSPDVGRLTIREAMVQFRTAPERLHLWLRRIDRWIAYANSVVEE